MYYLLTNSFREQETKLVQLLQKEAAVQSIYLLASSLVQTRTESIFSTTAPTGRSVGHYWLLALVGKSNFTCSQLQDRMESQCQAVAPTTIFVLPMATFNQWVEQGHPFAARVRDIAVLLHGSGSTGSGQAASTDQATEDGTAANSSSRFIGTAKEFMAGAELYIQRQQYPLAAFMLHQAAENSLHAMLGAGTGLHMNTHNLDRLVKYCSMLTDRVQHVLPRNRPSDIRLFNLLQDAYIHARYRDQLAISKNDIDILLKRVTALHQMALLMPTHESMA